MTAFGRALPFRFALLALAAWTALCALAPTASAETVIGEFHEDTTLTAEGGPYVAPGGLRVLGADGEDGVTTLTLEAGVVIRMGWREAASTGASGAIVALGTADAPVVFTSAAADPRPGDWRALQIAGAHASASRLLNVTVEYAGYQSPGLHLEGYTGTVHGCVVRRITGVAIHSRASDVTFAGCDVSEADGRGYTLDQGAYRLHGGSIHDVGGIGADRPVEVVGTRFERNAVEPLAMYGSTRLVDPIFRDNGRDHVLVSTWEVAAQRTWQALFDEATGEPVVYAHDRIIVENGAHLTLAPGAVVASFGDGLLLGNGGTLVARGTKEAPVLFTTVNPGGTWSGLSLGGTAVAELANVTFERTGAFSVGAIHRFQHTVPLVVEDCEIREARAAGLHTEVSAPLEVRRCDVHDGARDGVNAISVVRIEDSIFRGNAGYGVRGPGHEGITILRSRFEGNTLGPLSVAPDTLLKDLSFKGNAQPHIHLHSWYVRGDRVWEPYVDEATGAPIRYVHARLVVEPGATLRLLPGVIVAAKEDGVGVEPGGALFAEGTPEAPILFTTARDDMPAGSWGGVAFSGGSSGHVQHAIVERGGQFGQALFSVASNVVVEDCEARDGVGPGIGLGGRGATIRRCDVHGNAIGVRIDAAHEATVVDNRFDNAQNVLYYSGEVTWNTPKTAGMSFVGGPYLGGNWYSDYPGFDCDGDQLGDTHLPHLAGRGGLGDVHPLVLPDRVVWDTTPPVTVAHASGLAGPAEWFRSAVTVRLEAADVPCGLESTWYSVDDGPVRSYTDPFVVSGEGIHVVRFGSRDVVGNVEPTRSLLVRIDLYAPLASVLRPTWGSVSAEDAYVETDSDWDGVPDEVERALGSDPRDAGSVPSQIAPVGAPARYLGAPHARLRYAYVVALGETRFAANATDPVHAGVASGVSLVEFYVDGVKIGEDASAPYEISWNVGGLSLGPHSIEVRATDGAGNVAGSEKVLVFAIAPPRDVGEASRAISVLTGAPQIAAASKED